MQPAPAINLYIMAFTGSTRSRLGTTNSPFIAPRERLYRHFHGDSFGADAEHQHYLALDGDDDRREFARGYHAEFAGERVEAIVQKLMMGA